MDGVAPVIWLGYRHVDRAHRPRPCDVWPVRIAAGTFGPGLPRRDPLLSPSHAIFINGVPIPVKYLINSDTIDRVPVDEVIYYHVELPVHDVLMAESLTVGSYLDVG